MMPHRYSTFGDNVCYYECLDCGNVKPITEQQYWEYMQNNGYSVKKAPDSDDFI